MTDQLFPTGDEAPPGRTSVPRMDSTFDIQPTVEDALRRVS